MGENSSVTAAPPPPRGKSSAEEDALLKQFFAELSEVERDNEVNRSSPFSLSHTHTAFYSRLSANSNIAAYMLNSNFFVWFKT